ncbi:GntR family transcriptional regulator [Propionicimonas sp.]|uniref:GntR family transcriptional regulator n=1 Tax=Propionicimonas sp. TaxID=1955623 RepID=UPI0039E51468
MVANARPIAGGPVPKHQQVREFLVGRLVPGEAIPSERELVAACGVSRETVRRAIDGLVAEGLLQRSQGLGTFAVRPRLETRLHLASFSQDMRRRGLVPSTRLLAVDLTEPPADVAAALGIGTGGAAWRVVRCRLADDTPIAHEDGWYPADLLPGLDRHDLVDGSLYTILAEDYGLAVDHADQSLWGEAADAAMARVLDAPLHTPLLVFLRVSRAGGRPVEHVISRYRGDRYQVHMELGGSTASV